MYLTVKITLQRSLQPLYSTSNKPRIERLLKLVKCLTCYRFVRTLLWREPIHFRRTVCWHHCSFESRHDRVPASGSSSGRHWCSMTSLAKQVCRYEHPFNNSSTRAPTNAHTTPSTSSRDSIRAAESTSMPEHVRPVDKHLPTSVYAIDRTSSRHEYL